MITEALLLSILLSHDIPGRDAEILTCIAYHESKFNIEAINHKNKNGTVDYGLFQINSVWKQECKMTGTELLQLHNNIKCMKFVYYKQGLQAWSTYKKCK